ncbi:MAG TPA: starch synthase, partial [Burkholderiales bacterium]|nr:starch synthase [Burkholderiales bacterium]
SPHALARASLRAIELYRDPEKWRALALNGMHREFGWRAGARAYAALYERASAEHRNRRTA